jgi:hypothetical protein
VSKSFRQEVMEIAKTNRTKIKYRIGDLIFDKNSENVLTNEKDFYSLNSKKKNLIFL